MNSCSRFFSAMLSSQSVVLACTLGLMLMTLGCGGGSTPVPTPASTGQSSSDFSISGNWQFSMTAPSDKSFTGGVQGGFLLQNQSAVNGSAIFAVSKPGDSSGNCGNSGSAQITGSVNGNTVTLKAVAGGQTFTFKGSVSADDLSMTGTYDATAGVGKDGGSCGTAQTGLQWSAHAVPTIGGSIQGFIHSVGGVNVPITGILTQAANVGASSTTVTGSLTFLGYSCLGSSHQTVSLTGQISGENLVLNIISDAGLKIGQIGSVPNTLNVSSARVASNSSGAFVIEGNNAYGVITGACKSVAPTPGDKGDLCFAPWNASECIQPLALYPSDAIFPPQPLPTDYVQQSITSLSFPALLIGSDPVTRTITLANTDPKGATLTGLSIAWNGGRGSDAFPGTASDFNGQANFTEYDNCASTPGSTFSLGPRQSCTIKISFSPQQSCQWLPTQNAGGAAPTKCPPNLTSSVGAPPALQAQLVVKSPQSSDANTNFAVNVSGLGLSALVASVPELDFGAEAVSESSDPQIVSFTNQGSKPVQILPSANAPCQNPPKLGATLLLAQPVQSGDIDGIRVIQGSDSNVLYGGTSGAYNTVQYLCDFDFTSGKPNFQISADTCTGHMLAPQESCSLSITYAAQPYASAQLSGLDYFLQISTVKCLNSSDQNCEIDSGRFPVELRTNPPSPLRMSPAAGLEFGTQLRGVATAPLSLKLYNDPQDPNSGTVEFRGLVTTGDYLEQDDCGATIAPGSSCTIKLVFSPTVSGFDPGNVKINYVVQPSLDTLTQTIYMRGTGQ